MWTDAIRSRRFFAGAAAAALLALAGCAAPIATAPAEVRAALAPTGSLRVALYPGSPSSLVVKPDGERVGLAHEMGRRLARDLGVPVVYQEHSRAATVFDAVKSGQADFAFTNASEARMREAEFTPAVVRIELGYLVPAGSRITDAAQVDQPGVRVGVSEGSSSFAALSRQFRQARLVTVPSLDVAAAQMKSGAMDAFATNKGILHELSEKVPGSQVLPGRWGLEHIAIAVPKGRPATATQWLNAWAERLRTSPELKAMSERAGLRGIAPQE